MATVKQETVSLWNSKIKGKTFMEKVCQEKEVCLCRLLIPGNGLFIPDTYSYLGALSDSIIAVLWYWRCAWTSWEEMTKECLIEPDFSLPYHGDSKIILKNNYPYMQQI